MRVHAKDNLTERFKAAPIRRPSVRAWWAITKALQAEASKDNLSLIASGIAYYGFLAFVPTLTAAVLSYGLFAGPALVARHMSALADVLPNEAAQVIGTQLNDLVGMTASQAGVGLFLSLALASYGMMRGAGAMITALNIIFKRGESRSFISKTAVTVAVAAGMVSIFLVATLAISVFNILQSIFPDLGAAARTGLQLGFWLATAFVVRLLIATIYRFAPNRRPGSKKGLRPGSALATVGWVAATAGFAFYVRNFGSFNAVYGALGAVVIFLTWLYVSAYISLLGAELNRILEQADVV